MRFLDFFDIHDPNHLLAYQHLCENAQWPKGFVPEDAEFDPLWLVAIHARMSSAWAESVLSNHDDY